MKIAFIGLGNMGGPMAINLVRKGYEVSGFDLAAAAMGAFKDGGGSVAESATAAVSGAEVVVTMLPAGKHVEELLFGGDVSRGVLDAISAGALLIDCSTVSPTTAKRIAGAAMTARLGFLDAPVSGGTAGAVAGTLTFMVGGAADDVRRAEPVLSAMGQNIFHAGAAGAGQTAKICNNMLLGILMIGTSEALALGAANGLDAGVLSEIMKQSSGANWALEKYNPMPGVMDNVPASRGYTGGFGTDLMLKDLGLAQETAVASRTSIPLGGLARQIYAVHSAAGYGRLDFSSVIRLITGAVNSRV